MEKELLRKAYEAGMNHWIDTLTSKSNQILPYSFEQWYNDVVLPQADVIKSVCDHERVEAEDHLGNTHYCSKCRIWNY